MVVPLAEHPARAGTFIVADLANDPESWTRLDPDDLAERMFTRRADLPDDIERPPLKEVHTNKSPFLAPLSVLQGVDTGRIGLDVDACLRHLQSIRTCDGLAERVRRAFAASSERWPAREDPERMLYAGFPSPADKRRCDSVRATPSARLGSAHFDFDDPRYDELLFRYRARNWPDTLGDSDRGRWRAFVRDKLTRDTETTTLTLAAYFATIERLRAEHPPGPRQGLLDKLQAWGDTVATEFGL
jgi:exodeoxyribonuclease-1